MVKKWNKQVQAEGESDEWRETATVSVEEKEGRVENR